MPSLREDDAVITCVGAVENFRIRLFCATSQESVPEQAQTANGAFQDLQKNLSSDTKLAVWEAINKTQPLIWPLSVLFRGDQCRTSP
jgi:hypothetical protein